MRSPISLDRTFWFSCGSLAHIWQKPQRRNRSSNSGWSDEKGAGGPLAEFGFWAKEASITKMTSGYRHIFDCKASMYFTRLHVVCARCFWRTLALAELGSVYFLKQTEQRNVSEDSGHCGCICRNMCRFEQLCWLCQFQPESVRLTCSVCYLDVCNVKYICQQRWASSVRCPALSPSPWPTVRTGKHTYVDHGGQQI